MSLTTPVDEFLDGRADRRNLAATVDGLENDVHAADTTTASEDIYLREQPWLDAAHALYVSHVRAGEHGRVVDRRGRPEHGGHRFLSEAQAQRSALQDVEGVRDGEFGAAHDVVFEMAGPPAWTKILRRTRLAD